MIACSIATRNVSSEAVRDFMNKAWARKGILRSVLPLKFSLNLQSNSISFITLWYTSKFSVRLQNNDLFIKTDNHQLGQSGIFNT